MTVRDVHKTQRPLPSKHSQTKSKQPDWKKWWACAYFPWSGRDGNSLYHCTSEDMWRLKFFDKKNVSVSEQPSASGFSGDIHWERFSILIHLPKFFFLQRFFLQAKRLNVRLPSGFTPWVLLLPFSVFLNKLVQFYKHWWMGACQRWPSAFHKRIKFQRLQYAVGEATQYTGWRKRLSSWLSILFPTLATVLCCLCSPRALFVVLSSYGNHFSYKAQKFSSVYSEDTKMPNNRWWELHAVLTPCHQHILRHFYRWIWIYYIKSCLKQKVHSPLLLTPAPNTIWAFVPEGHAEHRSSRLLVLHPAFHTPQ